MTDDVLKENYDPYDRYPSNRVDPNEYEQHNKFEFSENVLYTAGHKCYTDRLFRIYFSL